MSFKANSSGFDLSFMGGSSSSTADTKSQKAPASKPASGLITDAELGRIAEKVLAQGDQYAGSMRERANNLIQLDTDMEKKILKGSKKASKSSKKVCGDTGDGDEKPAKKAKSTKALATISTKLTPEEAEKHQNLLMILSGYYGSTRFSQLLKDNGLIVPVATLKKKSIEQLEGELSRVRLLVSNKTSSSFINDQMKNISYVAEKSVDMMGYKCRGFTDTLFSNNNFLDTLEEYRLESLNFAYVKPKYRMLMLGGQTLLAVNAAHKMMMKQSQDSGLKAVIDFEKELAKKTPGSDEPAKEESVPVKDRQNNIKVGEKPVMSLPDLS